MIGREKEIAYLKGLVYEEEPQFIAVFGRRRIGKTFLVRESYKHRFFFQHTGISNNGLEIGTRTRAQLNQFAKSLVEAGYRGETDFSSWEDAFDGLKSLVANSRVKKKVIFIDELSWMDTRNSGIASALESFWNGWATARKEKDIVLIVCASATYWMMNNIVNAKGGLHNRLTGQIHLKPFTLRECEMYLESRNIVFTRHQILQCYMIMGGVPYYWSLLKKGRSLPQNIDDLFFSDNAPLQNEFDNLYSALFNKPEQYIEIVRAMSKANRGITRDEISEKTGIPSSGGLTRKLKELESCGFIRKYQPYGYKEKSSLYQLMDNYTLFYYHFLEDNEYDENFWTNQINTPKVNAWSGISFEKVCLEHIPQIKHALGISGVQTKVNAWHCVSDPDNGVYGSQVDLLIVRRDQIINLCEMKYSENDYMVDATFVKNQKRKISDFIKKTKTRYAIHSTLITYEIQENKYSSELQSIITCEDLFS